MPQIQIALIEDEADSRDATAANLRDMGYACKAYPNAEAFLKAVWGGETYDMLVVDLALPGIDGLELKRQLNDAGINIPCVAVTAYHASSVQASANEVGYDGYLPKPWDIAQLVEVIEEVLAH